MGYMNFIHRTIIVGLVLFYGVLAYLALTPQVSKEYYEYYISKTSHLSPKQQQLMPVVIPAKEYDHVSSAIAFSEGWSYPEVTHRWSDGLAASLYFKTNTPQKFEGLLSINVITNGSQKLVMSFNGIEVYSAQVQGDHTIQVSLDQIFFIDGINTLEFHLPDGRQPGNGDSRILAVAMKSFQLN